MKPSLAPVVWSPPKTSPLYPRSGRSLPALRFIELPARGEDVAVDRDGRLIVGIEDGRILRIESDGSRQETLVDTNGRPLGIEVAPDGALLICDTRRGLLRLAPGARSVEVLLDAREHDLRFCNNAAIAKDGTIYFSDSSRRFGFDHWTADLLEHSGTGRLFKLSTGGKLELLLSGLQLANGVALAADESFVAVAETGAYRVTRYWLHGERRGFCDLLVHDLPGFPDNLASNERGEIWIALASPRNPLLDYLHRSRPVLRQLAWALPDRLQPKPPRQMRVMAIDAQGAVVHDLCGSSDSFHMITGMREHAGTLFLASVEEPRLAAFKLPHKEAS